jgi:hypothetical protein
MDTRGTRKDLADAAAKAGKHASALRILGKTQGDAIQYCIVRVHQQFAQFSLRVQTTYCVST